MIKLIYIARLSDGLILCESQDAKEAESYSFAELKQRCKQILANLRTVTDKASINEGNNTFNILVQDGLSFMLVAETSYPKKLAFIFLDDIEKAFYQEMISTFGPDVDHRSKIETLDRPYQFIKFDRFINRKRPEYADARSNKNIERLNSSLLEVQKIMESNFDKLMGRGEEFSNIAEKASMIKDKSSNFKDKTEKLKWQLFLNKYAPWIVILVAIIFFFYMKFFYF
mmetsp:Transcript_54617/g.62619  ORF Transcript_54617/g.62619 Transcript_54617/m.62619 type:complete len:227 (-) Transcript_54617:475-1155(-)